MQVARNNPALAIAGVRIRGKLTPLESAIAGLREKVPNGGVRIIQRDACYRSGRLGGLMHLIDSDNKICILRRTAGGHAPDRRLLLA